MQVRKRLRQALKDKTFVPAPGAYDALTAKIIEGAGFPAVYMTGYGSSVAHFGLPDMGFLTMTEMVENAARIADAVNIPLIADADTGYGNPMNVFRTVRAFEKAGAAAVHIEDQEWPKRCGHMEGKSVIPDADMAAKIRAAVESRTDQDFLVIARTDALAVEGFERSIERAAMYAEAGADILFIEAPTSRQQVTEIPRRLPQKPLLINMAPRTPNLTISELESFGYSIALFPGITLAAAIHACREELERLKTVGRQRDFAEWGQSFTELNDWLDVPRFAEMDRKYKME